MDAAETNARAVLAPSARLRRLVGALAAAGVAVDLQKIGIPEGEPTCHWFFVMPAGMDPDHPDPDAPFGHGTSFSSDTEAVRCAATSMTTCG